LVGGRGDWTIRFETNFGRSKKRCRIFCIDGHVFLDLYVNISKERKVKMSIYEAYAVAAVISTIFIGFVYFVAKDSK